MNLPLAEMWGLLIGAAAFVGGIVAAIWTAWRKGKQAQQVKDLQDATKRTDAGRQAVQRGRDGGGTPDQRLRDNDGRWR